MLVFRAWVVSVGYSKNVFSQVDSHLSETQSKEASGITQQKINK
jgi:hypothetical protein